MFTVHETIEGIIYFNNLFVGMAENTQKHYFFIHLQLSLVTKITFIRDYKSNKNSSF